MDVLHAPWAQPQSSKEVHHCSVERDGNLGQPSIPATAEELLTDSVETVQKYILLNV